VTATQLRRRPALRGGRTLSDGRTLYWWAEILVIVAFYVVYTAIRNLHGGGADVPPHAFDHAQQVISFERRLGLYHEETFQDWAMQFRPLVIFANYFYGSLHFAATIFAGIFLYRWHSDEYPRFRTALGIATATALIGFTLYPLAPPRMFPHLGFVDTLAEDPAIWSFNSGGMQDLSNQFAAMPSVHVTWAVWTAIALGSRVKRRAFAALAWAYPVVTIVVIVITANHFIVDAAGGLAILAIGWVVAAQMQRSHRARTANPGAETEREPVDAGARG
jgi:hypothetical protein